MVKTNKNLKGFDKTKTLKRKNNGGRHMSQTYSLDSLENEETTFLGISLKNWAIGSLGIAVIAYNINTNKNQIENDSKEGFSVYKV